MVFKQYFKNLFKLSLLLILLAAGSVQARVVYVGTSGVDASNTVSRAQNPNTPYRTINAAITAASDGDIIQILPGNFGGFTLNKRITVRGSGIGITTCTSAVVISATPASGSDISKCIVEHLSLVSPTRVNAIGISIQTGYVTLNHIYESNFNNGVQVSNNNLASVTSLSNFEFNYCNFDNNTTAGFYAFLQTNGCDFSNFKFYHCSFTNMVPLTGLGPTNNTQNVTGTGVLIARISAAFKGSFSDLVFKNCAFNNCLNKGFYAETIENALFDNVSFDNCGWGSNAHSSAVDINIFGNDYATAAKGGDDVQVSGNLKFLNCRITGAGLRNQNGAAMLFKARSEGGGGATLLSRWNNPGRLENILIQGCVITGNRAGIRFGESDAQRLPANGLHSSIGGSVVVRYNQIFNNQHVDIDSNTNFTSQAPFRKIKSWQPISFGIRNYTTANVDAQYNYFGGSAPTSGQTKIITFTGTQTSGSNQITNVSVDFTQATNPNPVNKFILGSFVQPNGLGGPQGGNGGVAQPGLPGNPRYDTTKANSTYQGGNLVTSVVNPTTVQMSSAATSSLTTSVYYAFDPNEVVNGVDLSLVSSTGTLNGNNFQTQPVFRVNGGFEGSFATLSDALATASAGDTILNVSRDLISSVSVNTPVTLISAGAIMVGTPARIGTLSLSAPVNFGSDFTVEGNANIGANLDLNQNRVNFAGGATGSGTLKATGQAGIEFTGAGQSSTVSLAAGSSLGFLRMKRQGGTATLGSDFTANYVRLDSGIINTGTHTLISHAPAVRTANVSGTTHIAGKLSLRASGTSGFFNLVYPMGGNNRFSQTILRVKVGSASANDITCEGKFEPAAVLGYSFNNPLNRVSRVRYFNFTQTGSIDSGLVGLPYDSTVDFITDTATFSIAGALGGSKSWTDLGRTAKVRLAGTQFSTVNFNQLGYLTLGNRIGGSNLTNAKISVTSAPADVCRPNAIDPINVNVGYSTSGAVTSGTRYKVELSDKAGLFTSPTIIGVSSLNPSADGIIVCQIPGSVPASSKYRVRVIDSAANLIGDDNGADIKLGINPAKPIVTNSKPLVFCVGDSTVLRAPKGFVKYNWSNGVTADTQTVKAGLKVTLSVEDSLGCISAEMDSITVVVNALPNKPIISPATSLAICPGDSIQLNGPAGAATYSWSTGAATASIFVKTATNITLTVTNAAGCLSPASDITTTSMNPKPTTPTVSIKRKTNPFCQGDSVVLRGPAGFVSYSWRVNGIPTATQGDSLIVKADARVSVMVTDNLGCKSDTSNGFNAVMTPTPPKAIITGTFNMGDTTICSGNSVTFTAPAGYNYLWFDGSTGRTKTVSATSDVFVKLFSGTCEGPISDTIKVNVAPIPPAPVISVKTGTASFCDGQRVVLKGTAGFSSYTWIINSQVTTTTVDSISIDSSAVVILLGTSQFGCISPASVAFNTTEFLFQDNPQIFGIASGTDTTVCAGQSVTLTAAPGFQYLWSTGQTSQFIAVSSSQKVTLQIALGGGCFGTPSDTIEVKVQPLPAKPTITRLMGDTLFCQGSDSAKLVGPAGFANYVWNVNGKDTLIDTLVVKDLTARVVLRLRDALGCTGPKSDSVRITVLPAPVKPVITLISATANICLGDSVTIEGPAGVTEYFWNDGASGRKRTVKRGGNVLLFTANAAGCISPVSDPFLVTIKPTPSKPTFKLSGPAEFCQGDNVRVKAQTTGGTGNYRFFWNGVNRGSLDSLTFTTSDTVLVQITDLTSGCISAISDSLFIRSDVKPAKPNYLKATRFLADTAFCEGGSVSFSAPAGFKYLWSTGATTQSINVTQTTSVSFRVGIGGCFSDPSDVIEVTINQKPAKPIINADALGVCPGKTTTLRAPLGLPGYRWSTGEVSQTILAIPGVNYALQVFGNNGCLSDASDSINIQQLPLPGLPSIDTVGFPIFCDGDSVILNAPAGFVSYSWNTGQTTRSITVKAAGQFSVIVTNAVGCVSARSDTVETFVTPKPNRPTVTLVGTNLFCQGDSVVLRAPRGFAGYVWSNGSSRDSLVVRTSGTFSVRVRSGAGCLSDPSFVITTTMVTRPTNQGIVGNRLRGFVCLGDSMTLSVPTPQVGIIYNWTNGSQLKTGTFIVVRPTSLGSQNWVVQGINASGCTNAISAPYTVTAKAVPSAGFSITGSTVTADAAGPGVLYSYLNVSSGQIASVNRSFTSVLPGVFRLTVTDTVGGTNCTAVSTDFLLTALGDDLYADIRIFPNPAQGDAQLEVKGLTSTGTMKIVVQNSLGQSVLSKEVEAGFNQISERLDVAQLPRGTYTIQLIQNGRMARRRLVLQ